MCRRHACMAVRSVFVLMPRHYFEVPIQRRPSHVFIMPANLDGASANDLTKREVGLLQGFGNLRVVSLAFAHRLASVTASPQFSNTPLNLGVCLVDCLRFLPRFGGRHEKIYASASIYWPVYPLNDNQLRRCCDLSSRLFFATRRQRQHQQSSRVVRIRELGSLIHK